MEIYQSVPAVSGVVVSKSDVLAMAVAAHLARFKCQSRVQTESDLRAYVSWYELRDLDPLAANRPHVELYVRWLQEVRRFRASTVSRRLTVNQYFQSSQPGRIEVSLSFPGTVSAAEASKFAEDARLHTFNMAGPTIESLDTVVSFNNGVYSGTTYREEVRALNNRIR